MHACNPCSDAPAACDQQTKTTCCLASPQLTSSSRYKELKGILKHVLGARHAVCVPTKLSLSTRMGEVGREQTAQEKFFVALEQEVSRISSFTRVRVPEPVMLMPVCAPWLSRV